MDVGEAYMGYEKREISGKMKLEHKSPTSVAKGVEKKISCLMKRISKLENQRGNCHENLFKVKKKIHNQTNQIIKCFHERERHLLCASDEAFTAQMSSINIELSKLIASHASSSTLYQHSNGNLDILSKMNEYLSTVDFGDKAIKPLKFTGNLELAKADASNYGCLEGDFVGQNIPALSNENGAQPVLARGDENIQLGETDSQESFEIIDLLDEDKTFLKNDASQNLDFITDSADPHLQKSLHFSGKMEPQAFAKYSAFEKQLSELQNQLKGLNTSDLDLGQQSHYLREDIEGWLCRSSSSKKMNQAIAFPNTASESPAHLIRKAFSPYFGKENWMNWLSK